MVDGKPFNGNGKITNDFSGYFEGEIKDGKYFNGKGLYYSPDGSYFNGEYKNSLFFNGVEVRIINGTPKTFRWENGHEF